MSTSIEAQGQTVDEAIQIALNQLGVSRDKVEIDIVHHPRRGILGIGARRAKVRATIRETIMLDGEEFDMSGGADLDDKPRRRRRRGGRNRTGGREGERPAVAATPRPAPAAGNAGRPDGERRGDNRRSGEGDAGRVGGEGGRSRDDRRGRGGRGDQRGERRGESRGGDQQRVAPDAREGGRQGEQRPGEPQRGGGQQGREGDRPGDGREGRQGDAREGGRQGEQRGRGRQQHGDRRDRQQSSGGSRPEGASLPRPQEAAAFGDAAAGEEPARHQAPARRTPAAEEPPLDAAALDGIRARAEELVRELLQKMGFVAEVTSSIDEAAGEAVVAVRSENEGLLIGRRGQTLDSLEHIVNRMALRGDQYVEGRVLLDIGDYRRRRRESLEELATRLRGRAVTERRTVQVSPMSPRDRKFFALAFGGDEAVEVRALGAGFYRRVIVAPAGMGAAAAAAAERHNESDEEPIDSTMAEADAES